MSNGFAIDVSLDRMESYSAAITAVSILGFTVIATVSATVKIVDSA